MSSVDWTAVGSIASAIGVIVAIIVFIVESRRFIFTRAIDILLQYDDKFNSSEFREIRRRAASYLISGSKKEDKEGRQAICDVLNFFETIALLYKNKIIKDKMVWHTFSSWLLPYRKAAESYVVECRLQDPTSYEDTDILFKDILAIEQKRGGNVIGKSMIEVESIHSFLIYETELKNHNNC